MPSEQSNLFCLTQVTKDCDKDSVTKSEEHHRLYKKKSLKSAKLLLECSTHNPATGINDQEFWTYFNDNPWFVSLGKECNKFFVAVILLKFKIQRQYFNSSSTFHKKTLVSWYKRLCSLKSAYFQLAYGKWSWQNYEKESKNGPNLSVYSSLNLEQICSIKNARKKERKKEWMKEKTGLNRTDTDSSKDDLHS